MLSTDFSDFPVLETERLILRKLSADDTAALYDMRVHPLSMASFGRQTSETREDVEDLITRILDRLHTNEGITWAIHFKNTPGLIGTVGYHKIEKPNHRAEIGYQLSPDHWGTGIMQEAAKAVIDFGFNIMNLHSIEARISPDNARSKKVVLAHDFIKEGCLKESYHIDGLFYDSDIYSLHKKS